MDDTISKTEPQEQKTSGEPTAQPARRPWVKPSFERDSLKEALAIPESKQFQDLGEIS